MNIPAEIAEYLRSNFEHTRRPFCFLVAMDFSLKDWWGDAAWHGFTDLRAGENMLDRAPYLLGQSDNAPAKLPFVRIATGGTIEVHILPADGQLRVVVLDASEEHEMHQQRQQTANEVRLLHARQQKLISRQRSLIGDLVEAKAELDHRRREAERNIADKNKFIAMMSHEFRTPLSSIINYADLAREKDTSTANIRKSAEAIARASRHLHSLVDTVLDEARLESGRLRLNEQPFDVRALLDDLSAIMAPLAAEKGLSFAISLGNDVPEVIAADDVCLRQILINLLGNAVKFTESGRVHLAVEWSLGHLQATVADTGPGIALADQQRIFQAFERGDNSEDVGAPGAGLGLAISLDLSKSMRGQLELTSQTGEGTVVSVRIPASIVQGDSREVPVMPEPATKFYASQPATILLCDDDEDLLALAKYYLQRAGYGLLLARDGNEAVDKALAFSPDLVLMDINTPRMSGAEAASSLRAAGFKAPIVALTASDVRALNTDIFTDSLRKPIQMPRLLAQIQSYMQLSI